MHPTLCLECFSVLFPSFFSRTFVCLFVCILAPICIGFAWFCLLFYTHTAYSWQIWLFFFFLIKVYNFVAEFSIHSCFVHVFFYYRKCNINMLLWCLTFEAIHSVVSELSGCLIAAHKYTTFRSLETPSITAPPKFVPPSPSHIFCAMTVWFRPILTQVSQTNVELDIY